jgi:nitroimidazol reductase NimA-like FMN-containing flavoprotein (pyridoxamine 5'-phosphate oxidase superfamily)
MRATRKFNYLVANPPVALLVDNRSNRDTDVLQATAVTATGRAQELTEEDARAAASDALSARHPYLAAFVASPGCALVRVTVETYYVVTNFQSVVELHMPPKEHAD